MTYERVTVASGETLWGIAVEHAGDRDVRDVVQDIVELNHLQGKQVEPGMRLTLPLG